MTQFWHGFEKQAGILNKIPGVKNMRQGYRVIDKLVQGGYLMPDGTPTSALAAGRKALAGKAMAHGALKTTATGVFAHHLLKPKEQNA